MKTTKERHKYKPEDQYYQNITEVNNRGNPGPSGCTHSGEYRSCIQARTCKKTRGILKDEW